MSSPRGVQPCMQTLAVHRHAAALGIRRHRPPCRDGSATSGGERPHAQPLVLASIETRRPRPRRSLDPDRNRTYLRPSEIGTFFSEGADTGRCLRRGSPNYQSETSSNADPGRDQANNELVPDLSIQDRESEANARSGVIGSGLAGENPDIWVPTVTAHRFSDCEVRLSNRTAATLIPPTDTICSERSAECIDER